jgi:hypothetical protein
MKTTAARLVTLLPVLSVFIAGTAVAELRVSVTITGTIEEMLPVLQHLKDMGIGLGSEVEEDEAGRLRVHSVITGAEGMEAESGVPVPTKPVLGLREPVAEPAAVKRGGTVFVSVKVGDPDRVVDTIGATLGPDQNQSADLYDNGTHGDETPRDGVWSRVIKVDEALPLGRCPIVITAYDVNGEPVVASAEGGRVTPLVINTEVTVTE